MALGLLAAFQAACGGNTASPARSNDTPSGLRTAALSWAHTFLTGTPAQIQAMEVPECGQGSELNGSAAAYLAAMRAHMEQYLGQPLASIRVTGVQLRNVTTSRGEAEVQFNLPAAKVGNDNWVAYEYQSGQWKVSDCNAPIGGESTSTGTSSVSLPAAP